MAYAQDGSRRAYPADADYSVTGQYRAMKRTATGIVQCGAADNDFLGMLQDDPKAGESGTVQVRDVSKAVAGGVVALTDELTTDATGRLVAAATGNPIVARPLEAAAAAGDLFSVEIRREGAKP